MKFGYSGGALVRLVWGLLLLGAVTSMATTLALGLAGAKPAGLSVPDTPAGQFALLLGLIVFIALFGAPLFAAHEVGPQHLVLRQGLHFRAAVPYDDVVSVERTERTPFGLGVRWYPGELYVLTWPADLVAFRLRRPTRFRLLGLLPLPKVSTVVVNVDQPDALIGAVRCHLAGARPAGPSREPTTSRRIQ